jgi:hypothetical protein
MALYHRLPFASHWKRYASLLAALIGEAIPYVDVCAFWALDALYIVHAVRAEDRQTHQQLMQTIQKEQEEEARQEWIANYQAQQAEQAQEIEDEDVQEELDQETVWQNNDGAGRMNPPKSKTTPVSTNQKPTSNQLSGKPVGSNGIIK